MRGKDTYKLRHDLQPGITPAYAGKSYFGTVTSVSPQDHPRLCGEKVPRSREYSQNQGSPPPMRGKADTGTSSSKGFGITPAYAGKSMERSKYNEVCGDHPRLCGEKTKKIPKQRYFFHQPASFSFSLQYT